MCQVGFLSLILLQSQWCRNGGGGGGGGGGMGA